MSNYQLHANETTISIPRIITVDSVNYYEILVKCGQVMWTVNHRYRDFAELHDQLVSERGVSKDKLPPKKVLGNKSPTFLKKRQEALEQYLREMLIFLKVTMPREFVEFLDFHRYDIIFLVQHLASSLFLRGDAFLAKSKKYGFSVLELHAISERMQIPCPPTEAACSNYNFSHILDFCAQLETIIVLPTKNSLPTILYDDDTDKYIPHALHKPIGSSNLIPVQLRYELSVFKVLRNLIIYGVPTENIQNVGALRETLSRIEVYKSETKQICQIALCDNVHKDAAEDELDKSKWKNLRHAVFKENQLTVIDRTIRLFPTVKDLVLDKNKLESIAHLSHLNNLQILSLRCNRIAQCANWHVQLGNLVTLNLSQNRIRLLEGLGKLYSLVNLDLSCNLIDDINEIDYIGNLPLLENLRLMGNPVAGGVDYRARVLSRFGERLQEIYLDNEKGNQTEYDMALVLSALRISAQKSHRKLHSLLEPGGSTPAEEQQEKQKNDTERAGPSGGAGS
ncbi:nischarin-like isoform X2 [Anopheles merus]|uniref:nischarin-like isoform X2 n=1 Tax=Anopheles merus TaxID=30066 RepID=UPI001BE45A20|nr:nischarin-like isoform X2 [Anopheles merus]XP_041787419.1 nischarin-like isoform X2 [Anopheles merus]